jgi:hypothetical protein
MPLELQPMLLLAPANPSAGPRRSRGGKDAPDQRIIQESHDVARPPRPGRLPFGAFSAKVAIGFP